MMATSVESSKFARWFCHEDSKPSEDLPSKSQLCMVVKNENPGPQNISPGPTVCLMVLFRVYHQNKLPIDSMLHQSYYHFHFLNSTAMPGIPEPAPVTMTCEDLEQAMLAHVASNNSSTQKSAVQSHEAVLDEPTAKQKVAVDKHASH
uniref:Uncharacterized protein n=1 Tax=Triticum urartu TaxID=4572 RepID=A0A8R7TBA9_TRIUA